MNIEQLSAHTPNLSAPASAYQKVEALVRQAASDGQITSEEEHTIKAAMLQSGQITPAMCSLFRHLQERVWNGELTIPARED